MSRAETLRAAMSSELDKVLAEGETVVMFGACTAHVDRLGATVVRHGTLFVSNQRCGVLTNKVGGKDLVSMPLALIDDVVMDRNITAAQMTVTCAGVKMRMERMQVNGAKEFVRVLREQMATAKTQVTIAPAAVESAPSVAGEIQKLADLHQKGLLSVDEFAAAKSKLLGESAQPPSYWDGTDLKT
jgi:hypothetical protein